MQSFVLTRREQHNVGETDCQLSMNREQTGHDKEVLVSRAVTGPLNLRLKESLTRTLDNPSREHKKPSSPAGTKAETSELKILNKTP